MGFAGPFARKGGVWVSGVWCPGLSNLPGRPASAPAASNKARRGQSSRGRPKSAPAHIDVTFAEITCGSGAADAGLPAPDYPQPLAELPGGITASWLTGLLYRTGVLEPASGVIVAHVREITDIYGGTGVVYRLSVVYGGPRQQRMDTAELNIPSSFVLKIYDSDALLPNARRELLFYSSLAHRTPIRTPKCYWSKLRPHCGAQPRCIPDEWPTLEEFLCGPRWCAISEDLLPMDLSGTDSDVDSSSVSESSWGASEAWNPESPRTRPSIATRYSKALRAVGITKVGQLDLLHRFLPALRHKGIKEKHLKDMLRCRVNFARRNVHAALLLEDVQLSDAAVVPHDDGGPASIWMADAALVVEQIARVHAAWWGSPELPMVLEPRAYNTNTADTCWERLDELWPTLSKYVHKFKKLKLRYASPDDMRQLLNR